MGSRLISLPILVLLAFGGGLAGCPDLDLSQEGMNHHDKRTGAKHGLWTTYHSNGLKASEGVYAQGKKAGEWVYWDAKGKITKRELWVAGVVDDLLEGDAAKAGFESDVAPDAQKGSQAGGEMKSDPAPELGQDADRGIGEPDRDR